MIFRVLRLILETFSASLARARAKCTKGKSKRWVIFLGRLLRARVSCRIMYKVFEKERSPDRFQSRFLARAEYSALRGRSFRRYKRAFANRLILLRHCSPFPRRFANPFARCTFFILAFHELCSAKKRRKPTRDEGKLAVAAARRSSP